MVVHVRSTIGAAIVGGSLTLAVSSATAQGYPQAGAPADPRAASKAAAPQTGYSQPAQTPPPRSGTYQQAPAQGYAPASGGYQQPQPPAWAASQPVAARPSAAPGYILAPPVLPYREGVEPPQGYVQSSYRNGALMTGGGLSFGAAYVGGLIYGIGKSFDNGTGWLAVPIIGPWAAIGSRDFKCKSSRQVTQSDIDQCVDGALSEVTSITFLAMMGIGQVVGATLFFVGVGDTTEEWVRADVAGVDVSADAGQVGDSGYGLWLSGAF